ncbi:MAG: LPS assembly lipoprotein LptE [Tateyamaria sp.]|jgi:LPS-assembly lipoprotein|uniref:LPS assembly lipoprotein LptE n=1 Tax=Tateyamaria sp. TaxID=1929288 RepID=UPI0032DE26CA
MRVIVFLVILALGACGFTPVYGPNGAGTELQNRVLVDKPDDRTGFLMVQRLEERLGRTSDPVYRLAVDLTLRPEDRALDLDGAIRRVQLIGIATYRLIEIETNAVVQTDTVDDFVGYSATGTTVATLAARRDAQERLMTILADQIVLQLQGSDL